MNTRAFIFAICNAMCLILLFVSKAVTSLGIIAFLLNLAVLIYNLIVIATQEKTISIIQKNKRIE